jgi:hypothetical protein
MQLFSSNVLGRSVAISIATISTALSAGHDVIQGTLQSQLVTFKTIVLDELLAAHNCRCTAVRSARW